MRPVVFDKLIAGVAFVAVILGWELLEWLQQRREAREETDTDKDDGSGRLINLATWTAVPAGFALAFADVAHLPGNRWVPYVVGCGILLVGIAFRQWAVRTLGRHFRRRVTIQASHEIVRTGPYRVLRHPGYAGSLLALFGMAVALDSWLSLALCTLPVAAAVLHRIRVEEAALEAALGEAYRDYERSTSRLIPGIW